MSRRAHVTAALALLLAACAPPAETMTQVVVKVDAENRVRERSARLVIRVLGSDSVVELADVEPVYERSLLRPDYPLDVALAPLYDDEDRLFLLDVHTEDERGNFVAGARLVSGYSDGQIRRTFLLLEDACMEMRCTNPLATCREGSCTDARDEFASNEGGGDDPRDASVDARTNGSDVKRDAAMAADAGEPSKPDLDHLVDGGAENTSGARDASEPVITGDAAPTSAADAAPRDVSTPADAAVAPARDAAVDAAAPRDAAAPPRDGGPVDIDAGFRRDASSG